MALMLRRSPMKLLEEFARKTVQKKPGLHSNRAQKGMYAGKDVRYGNTITFSAKKNKRRWLPNVQSKRLWSEMLNEHVPLKVTTTALRGVDKAGGLDNYLLYMGDRLQSTQAEAVKQRLLTLLGDGARARILAVRAMLRRKLRNIGPDGQRTWDQQNAETSDSETAETETDEHSDLPHLDSSDVADDVSSSTSSNSGSSSGAGSSGPVLA